jgi:hypothetical protein
MFCGTDIARLMDGKLYPLGNKCHILLEKQLPGLYILNGCGGCVNVIDWNDQTILDQIHDNVVQCMEFVDALSGLTPEQIQLKQAARQADGPVVGFRRVETNLSSRARNVADYKAYLKKQQESS